jgi:aminoglycoside phosphotransferase (APT) family kinase protein
VVAALQQVASAPPPHELHSLEEQRDELAGWTKVEKQPEPFLGLGLCSPKWLAEGLPILQAAEEACVLDGSALLHLDVRSDNICLRGGQAMLVDWNHAVVGNPVLDVAAWLPSLHAEGGPGPEMILPAAPEAAAFMSGFLCSEGCPSPSGHPAHRSGCPAGPAAQRTPLGSAGARLTTARR